MRNEIPREKSQLSRWRALDRGDPPITERPAFPRHREGNREDRNWRRRSRERHCDNSYRDNDRDSGREYRPSRWTDGQYATGRTSRRSDGARGPADRYGSGPSTSSTRRVRSDWRHKQTADSRGWPTQSRDGRLEGKKDGPRRQRSRARYGQRHDEARNRYHDRSDDGRASFQGSHRILPPANYDWQTRKDAGRVYDEDVKELHVRKKEEGTLDPHQPAISKFNF